MRRVFLLLAVLLMLPAAAAARRVRERGRRVRRRAEGSARLVVFGTGKGPVVLEGGSDVAQFTARRGAKATLKVAFPAVSWMPSGTP